MAIKFASALDVLTAKSSDTSLPVVANNIKSVANKSENNLGLVANKHGKYADKEARKIYMRDYMRKKRSSA